MKTDCRLQHYLGAGPRETTASTSRPTRRGGFNITSAQGRGRQSPLQLQPLTALPLQHYLGAGPRETWQAAFTLYDDQKLQHLPRRRAEGDRRDTGGSPVGRVASTLPRRRAEGDCLERCFCRLPAARFNITSAQGRGRPASRKPLILHSSMARFRALPAAVPPGGFVDRRRTMKSSGYQSLESSHMSARFEDGSGSRLPLDMQRQEEAQPVTDPGAQNERSRDRYLPSNRHVLARVAGQVPRSCVTRRYLAPAQASGGLHRRRLQQRLDRDLK